MVMRYRLVEEEVAVGSLPVAVVNALSKKYSGMTVKHAARVLNGSGQLLFYDLTISYQNMQHEIHITAAGKFVGES
jgi:hypothetical protein